MSDDPLAPLWLGIIFVVGMLGLEFSSDVVIPALDKFVLYLGGVL